MSARLAERMGWSPGERPNVGVQAGSRELDRREGRRAIVSDHDSLGRVCTTETCQRGTALPLQGQIDVGDHFMLQDIGAHVHVVEEDGEVADGLAAARQPVAI